MPEGPSILILKELVQSFRLEGKEITEVYGNTGIDKERLLHQKILSFKSWGKHFLICFKDFSLRIHLMLFGTYRINGNKGIPVTIGFIVGNTELNFYNCVPKLIEGNLDWTYNWAVDVLSDRWDPKAALKKIEQKGNAFVCDVLLDQDTFAGIGNIIKNEVLYRIGIHPLSKVKYLSREQLKLLIKEARNYSFDFLRWKKENTLKKHWLIYSKESCPLKHEVVKLSLGKSHRMSYFCELCQKLYSDAHQLKVPFNK